MEYKSENKVLPSIFLMLQMKLLSIVSCTLLKTPCTDARKFSAMTHCSSHKLK
jgi:hypothetical protein